jgi:hypothetical protein
MPTYHHQLLATGLLSIVALGCTENLPTGASQMPVATQAEISNGPADLPNVFRFEGVVGGGVFADSRTDLLVIDGLPEDPTELDICGGTEGILNLADFQVSGALREVFQLLAQAEENIHVYQLSTFVDICTSEPMAQGAGRLILNDNDAAVSGTRTNSFGARLNGPVTLAAGGTAQLAAEVRFLIEQDGTFSEVSSMVQLSR